MSKLSQIIAENELSSLLTKNYMGLELEEHRLLKDGRISRYPYPAEFLSRRHNPYLKTDFADNMLEISGRQRWVPMPIWPILKCSSSW